MAKFFWIGGVMLLLAPLAPATAAEVEITIKGMQFVPAKLEIKPGDTVRWHNDDLVPHTVTAKRRFDSGAVQAGNDYHFKFQKAGTIKYICRFHPAMKGEIRVKP